MTDVQISEALAEAIEQRRRALGMTVTQLANAAGVTQPGLMPLRRGEVRNYQERLTGPVCRALGWTPDSISRLLAGEEPVEAATPPDDPTVRELAADVAELQDVVLSLTARLRRLEQAADGAPDSQQL